MNKPHVFLADQVPTDVLSYISTHCEYTLWDQEKPLTKDELKKALKSVDGALLTGYGADADLIEGCNNLKVISTATVGYDRFDPQGLAANNVLLTNTPMCLMKPLPTCYLD